MGILKWLVRRFPSFTIPTQDGRAYLRRYIVFKPSWCKRLKIYVHEILISDDDRDLHDHPWPFTSVILSNYYLETFLDKDGSRVTKKRGFLSVIRHKAEDCHCLTLENGPVWTLFIAGKTTREWGFHTPSGWEHWRPYLDRKFGKKGYLSEDEIGLMKYMED